MNKRDLLNSPHLLAAGSVNFKTNECASIPIDGIPDRLRPHIEGSEHPYFTLDEWRAEVACGDTRRGYDNWVENNLEQSHNEDKDGTTT